MGVRRVALLVGVNKYSAPGNDLNGCVNDANEWEKVMVSRGVDEVFKLLDEQATVEAQIETVKQILSVQDTHLFHFNSSHGSYLPDKGGDERFGYDQTTVAYDGMILDDTWYKIHERRASGCRVFVFSDSCHSGTVMRMSAGIARWVQSEDGDAFPIRIRFMPPTVMDYSKQFSKLSKNSYRVNVPNRTYTLRVPNCVSISGCRDTEYSADTFINGQYCGAASYFARKALDTTDESSTYAQWYRAIRRFLPSFVYRQTPIMDGTREMFGWKAL